MHRFFNAKWNFIDIQTLQHITKTFLALIWVEHPYHLVKHEMTRYCITPLIPQSSSLSRFHLVKSLRRIISITSIIYRSCESESWGFMTFHDQKKTISMSCPFFGRFHVEKTPLLDPRLLRWAGPRSRWAPFAPGSLCPGDDGQTFSLYPWRHLKRMSWGKS